MKIEHLLQGYKSKGLNVTKNDKVKEDKAGILQFTPDIFATYYEDNEVVTSIQIISNAITCLEKTALNQMNHCINLIKVLSFTIDLVTDATQEQRNKLLEALGLYNGSIKDTNIVELDRYMYKSEVKEGLFIFTIAEKILEDTPGQI